MKNEPAGASVLVIDDDRSVLHMVTAAFQDTGIKVLTSGAAAQGVDVVRRQKPDAVLLDIILPEISGLDAFKQIHEIDSKLPVIFITAGGASDTAIEAMMLGGADYLVKPLDVAKLRESVRQAIETRRLMSVPVGIAAADEAPPQAGDLLVGKSPKMLDVYKAIGRVAGEDVTVLIHGESGTGKELVARAIYQHSPRKDGPFLAVNCAALADSLLESELFGHEKGAFTGAEDRRIGKFEQCNGGTIFLDEIGDMSPLTQSKILRLLQEQKFERVGGNETIATEVRVIAATNRDLQKMVEESKYRADLFYRLNGFAIDLPPLRERGHDVVLLVEHFLSRYRRTLEGRQHIEGIAPEAVEILSRYRWPGNVRELQSVIRQAMLNATGPIIVPGFLPEEVRGGKTADRAGKGPAETDFEADLAAFVERRLKSQTENLYSETLTMMERYLLHRVLTLTEGNQSQAARILGITRGSLRNKIRSHGISVGQVVSMESDGG